MGPPESRPGGMSTKIEAAKIATDGRLPHGDRRRSRGAPDPASRETRVYMVLTRLSPPPRGSAGSRDRWSHAACCISTPARRALFQVGAACCQRASRRVEGGFQRGDCVVLRDQTGAEIGRGLVAYDAEDAVKIRGRSSADILSILGHSPAAPRWCTGTTWWWGEPDADRWYSKELPAQQYDMS